LCGWHICNLYMRQLLLFLCTFYRASSKPVRLIKLANTVRCRMFSKYFIYVYYTCESLPKSHQIRSLFSSNINKPTDHRNGSQEKWSSAGAIRAIPAILMEMEDNYTFFLI
jgi:hypothetical protein